MARASATDWRAVAAEVVDPEMPFLTIDDLGVLRGVAVDGDRVIVTITPTYSGCPAMAEIMTDIHGRVMDAGAAACDVRLELTPAWSSDHITAAGRRKLAAAGIAPPSGATPKRSDGPVPLTLSRTAPRLTCPLCGSADTVELSRFSATSCKSLHRCQSCGEPFEHLKDLA